MNAEGYPLAATVILVLPMLYFLFSTITFLLARLSDPVVTWMLRGLFNTYFLALIGCSTLGVLAFGSAGRPDIAAGIGVVAGLALGARRWFLRRLDAAIAARNAGDPAAVRRLRQLHLSGMAYNAVQFAVIVLSIPNVFVAA
ncbi:MAG: hypothetical protein ACOYOH_02590 [Paracraurococcus sp.]